ncbi:MAG TPA: acyltransferase [Candidatus Polarisedimenticolia bacterium]|nr:acyltransferase [Candidatus Polarisedimenticolia bacterium]
MRFSALDGWRGLCALMVCIFHFNSATRWAPGDNAFAHGGYLFVDFFFVLSGFVITHSYAKRIHNRGQLGRFMLRRFGRVWPLHAAILAAWVALEIAALAARPFVGHFEVQEPFTGNNSPAALLSNILLLQALGLHRALTWNGPSWSISAEFWTYLVFGLFCLMPLRKPATATLLAGLLAAGGAIVVTLFCPRYIDATYDFGFFRCVYGFFLGHLVYRLRASETGGGKAGPGRAGMLAARYGSLFEFGTVILVVLFVALAQHAASSLAAPIVFAFVVYLFSFESGQLSRLFCGPPFRQFGRWSYSIYMVHALILQILVYAVRALERLTDVPLRAMATVNGNTYSVIAFDSDLAMSALCAAFVAMVIATASQTYRFVEEPSRLYFNALAHGGPHPTRAKIAE